LSPPKPISKPNMYTQIPYTICKTVLPLAQYNPTSEEKLKYSMLCPAKRISDSSVRV
jgi:hypothetical protein